MRLVAEERAHTIRLMAEQERRNVEKLRQSLASRYTSKLQKQLDVAVKRLSKLDEELQLTTASLKVRPMFFSDKLMIGLHSYLRACIPTIVAACCVRSD